MLLRFDAHYDGYHLLATIDPAGYTTNYRYDLCGRKIEENREGRVTRFHYDTLGFLTKEERNHRHIEYIKDSLGRVLSKAIDGVPDTTWTYDRSGNISSMHKEGTSTFLYDAHDRLIKKTSPDGSITSVRYDIEPQQLVRRTIDALGTETIETFNPHNQLLTKQVAGQFVEQFEYDAALRLISQDHLTYTYTSGGRKALLRIANQDAATWTYTPAGRVLAIQKPDGTIRSHRYDEQGRLVQVASREFRYDALNRLIGGTGFVRTLDPFGNILREEWTHGLWIETDYDDWDRPTERRLCDQSRITYEYGGPFLTRVVRYDAQQTERYAHSYKQYNANGNPLLQQGVCPIISEYDQVGRNIHHSTSYFQEQIEYDAANNILRKG